MNKLKTAAEIVLENFQAQRDRLAAELQAERRVTEMLVLSKTIRELDLVIRKLTRKKK